MINRYAGNCGKCRQRVEAGAGQAINDGGRWQTYHHDCVPVRIAPAPGTHTGWHDLPLVGFDLEGTLPEPMETRIVSAALVYADGTRDTWLIDPGVPIPADATALHGFTDEMLRSNGRPPREALAQLGAAVAKLVADGIPLVAFRATYDVTALHTELARHGLPAIDWDRARIVDPYVLHKEVEPKWYAPARLGDLCGYYQVRLDAAHEAASDAQAAAGLARAIAARHERIARMPLDVLHKAQADWHAAQGRDLQAHFDRQGRNETVNLEWPLETRPRTDPSGT
ncbi:exonuclease domain-containing protein [Micromonospora echinofusca]|uniref:DNA polymerase III subunit epsilon n=1 Tax=Micromonospora echinofusca TaxID=47858 RepID=A0ABS3VZB8_MICEH|nr:exonuclease domain-containing protein [Micromonospora echinofusca]MBO4209831.1 DNA polymerase III subunit epsilon [Micromonospora echinofusca]